MSLWKKVFGGAALVTPPARGLADARAYAIGDVHGRLDLLDALLEQIAADLVQAPVSRAFLILLGDLIDRGPASAQVVERLRTLSLPGVRIVILMGNHEEMFLRVLDGEPTALDGWLRYGGRECLESYGVDPDEVGFLEEQAAAAELARRIPAQHVRFLREFGDTFRFGDYLFVHAGIRPGVAIDDQSTTDLRWIREPFLSDAKHHGFTVVHGHTISEAVVDRPNRIGIDTGAYRTGVLTALAIDGEERRFLEARAE